MGMKQRNKPEEVQELFDEIEHLLDNGMTPEEVAKAFDTNPSALERYSHRKGRLDIAARVRVVSVNKKKRSTKG